LWNFSGRNAEVIPMMVHFFAIKKAFYNIGNLFGIDRGISLEVSEIRPLFCKEEGQQ
jgi:hypothetical protein